MYSKEIVEYLKGKSIEIGNEVIVKGVDFEFHGIIMPSYSLQEENFLAIKLGNGYNIGISLEKIKNIEKIGEGKKIGEFPKRKVEKKESNIGLFYTGGTIGSKIDYVSGGVHMLLQPEELFYEVPELSDIANFEVKNLFQIASEDMNYKHWQKIAKEVADSLNKGVEGIVITHGTDTMHFTSAALSFMLQNLYKPVILTGAQRSSDRGSSDAFMNLICSAYAAKSDFGEVGVCMHASSNDDFCFLHRGTKVRKMHTSARDAFKSINSKEIAKIFQNGKIEFISQYRKRKNDEKVKAEIGFEEKVALLKAYPNSDPSIISFFVDKGYKGIVIEGTGLGHVPTNTEFSWIPEIKNAVEKGVYVIITSQCLYGRVNSYVYRNLRILSSAGAIHCEDMLPEVAYIKLAWLLGNKKENIKELIKKNIVGEITQRTLPG
ncbi:MAG: Glu-tRNA(Gln) amidotransferase subunit GatD [Candidatus Micrarchaeia archaeon]